MNPTVSQSAFAEADERALDRAVRRLPGYWTWDYAPDTAGPDTIVAVVSPPWDPSQEAFHIFCRPGDAQPFSLESDLERRASGEYADLDHLLRGLRAVVMGDDFSRDEPEPPAPLARTHQASAKGRPQARSNPNELTARDCDEIETILSDWHDAGRCTLSNCGGPTGYLFASWDERFPAFTIEREGARICLKDNITFGLLWGARGTFSGVASALEAVRCVLDGDFVSKNPEVEALFALYRAAAREGYDEVAGSQEHLDAEASA